MNKIILILLLSITAKNYAAINITDDDYLSGLNRAIFSFNMTVDKAIIMPIAKTYKNNMPIIIQIGINNFMENLYDVPTFFNQLLQLKFKAATHSFTRILVNSTIGIGGLFDIASEIQLRKGSENFGQTLGFYGVDNGIFIMLPVFGPTTLRGIVAEIAYYPATFDYNFLTKNERLTKQLIGSFNTRVNLLTATDNIYNSLDPYTKMRLLYLQNLKFRINDGNIAINDIDFEDD